MLARTLAPAPGSMAGFGRAVALTRSRAVVGAYNAALLFDVRTGTQRAALTPPVYYDPDMSMNYEPYLP